MQSNHSGYLDNIVPLQNEGYGTHARPWQHEVDALRRDVQALQPDA